MLPANYRRMRQWLVDRRLQVELLEGRENMFWTIFVVLLVLWALGLVTAYTFGGFIHILLFAAGVILVMRVFRGRRIA